MFIEHSPQVGGLGIAWAVKRPRLDTGGDHGRNRKGNRRACTLMRTHDVAAASIRARRVSVENVSVGTDRGKPGRG